MNNFIAISQNVFSIKKAGHVYPSTMEILKRLAKENYKCSFYLGDTVEIAEINQVSNVDVIPFFTNSIQKKKNAIKRIISKLVYKISGKEKYIIDWNDKKQIEQICSILKGCENSENTMVYFPYATPAEVLAITKELKKRKRKFKRIFFYIWKDSVGFFGKMVMRKSLKYIKKMNECDVITDSYRYANIINRSIGCDCFKVAPMMSEVEGERKTSSDNEISISFLGRAFEEKGFFDLYNIIKTFNHLHCDSKALFYIQAGGSEGKSRFYEECNRLESSFENVTAINKSLESCEYKERMLTSDIILLPYLLSYYRVGTSGPFAEAMSLGIPTVQLMGTWMASKMVEFHNDFVREIIKSGKRSKMEADCQGLVKIEKNSTSAVLLIGNMVADDCEIVKICFSKGNSIYEYYTETDKDGHFYLLIRNMKEGVYYLSKKNLKYDCLEISLVELQQSFAADTSIHSFGICEDKLVIPKILKWMIEDKELLCHEYGIIRKKWNAANGIQQMCNFLVKRD